MKKTVLSISVLSALVFAQEPLDVEQIKSQIAEKNAQKKEIEANIASLKAQLPQDQAFITHTELGYIKTDGNTKTETFNLDANAKKQWDANSVAIMIDAQYATNEGLETKNRYTVEANYAYDFTSRFSFDYLAGYKDDKFSGFNYRFYTGPGAKYKLIDASAHKLSIQGNILYSRDSEEDAHYAADGTQIIYPNPDNLVMDPTRTVAGVTESYSSYRAKIVYDWKILESLKFSHDTSLRSSFDESNNYFIISKSALTSKLTDILSAGMSYKVDYTNLPAEGKRYSDETFTLNLIIDY
jgi:putative salt-induced outer membrane protein